MNSEQSRLIVLTGASRGLGRALTREFVQRGHTVYGCSRDKSAMAGLAREYGLPHSFSSVDVTDAKAVSQWANHVLDHGAPDLLLNIAAVINPCTELWRTKVEDFSNIVDINIKGVFHVLRAFLPTMIENGSGVIVNFSSGWGRSTSPQVAPYCASKWAIEGLTRALADELPFGLSAVPLNPGVIHTDMLDSCFGDAAASYPGPEAWAKKAAPFLLELGPEDNGDPLTAPS